MAELETRHFMDDERQITISLETKAWESVQESANALALKNNWLAGTGGDYENLNIWIIGRLSACPPNVSSADWIMRSVK
jgi:hypothetical protein